MVKKSFSWSSLFGSCVKVQSEPSPVASPTSDRLQEPKKLAKQSSFTRVICSDISNETTPEALSTWSSSILGANLLIFTFAEMKAATHNFSGSNFVGKGGFGPVFKGHIDDSVRPGLKSQTVAVKVLDLDGVQGHKEWLTEVILLGQLRHPHLVKLIGYCYEDENRLLVYEFMARGSLENHLFKKFLVPLTWDKRVKIAVGAAKGLKFLHEVDQPVIYRDFKASNVLIDSDFKAKLSDFGLAKDGPQGDATHVSTRIMGTHGYAAPEYIMTGHLTVKSDVYSFGVVLLELLTGRQSLDKSRPSKEQNLVEWARPYLNDPRRLHRIIDPSLDGQYSTKGMQKAAALAFHCLSHLPRSRPDMSMVVEILEPILDYDDIPIGTFVFTVNDAKERAESAKEKEEKGNAENAQTASAAEKPLELNEVKQIDNHGTHKKQGDQRKLKEKSQNRHHRHRHDGGRRRHSSSNDAKPVPYSDTALYTKPSKRRSSHDK